MVKLSQVRGTLGVRTPPRGSCCSSCAPASCWPASTSSSSTSRCPTWRGTCGARGLADLSWVLNAYAIVYAVAARALRAPGRALRRASTGSCSASRSSRPRRPRAAPATSVAGARRVPHPSGGRRGAADADVAEPRPRHHGRRAAAPARCARGRRSAGWPRRSDRSSAACSSPASWRWVFFVNVPIGLAALVVGWRRLPRVAGHPVPHPDALGAVLVTVGVAALTLGLVKGEDWGWGSAATVGALACRRARARALRRPLPARSQPARRPGAVPGPAASPAPRSSMTLFSIAFGAMLLSIVLWEQDVWGWSALQTGLAIAPGPLMVPLFSFLVAGPAHRPLRPGRGRRRRSTTHLRARASPGGRSAGGSSPTTSATCSAACSSPASGSA